ncbi:MAG TPA: hypothetical protein VE777_02545 [Gaiellales bacterium]|jgi:hypothetical protein|nr:hypothetical protein [Gaiellales bacterium]
MGRLRWIAVAAIAFISVVLTSTAALGAAKGEVVYKSTATPLPGNLPSVGAEAYSFAEFGDEVTSAHHRHHRVLRSVKVTLSSWGCQAGHWYSDDCVSAPDATFSIPITLTIYRAASTEPSSDPVGVGAKLLSVTRTFQVPYRPSADPVNCTGGDAGKWFKPGQGCFNGLATNITFTLHRHHRRLPRTVVFGIAYNTTHYGYDPIGESAPCFTGPGGCPYDSLNIALGPEVVVGSKPYPDTVFQNATAAEYCDNTPTPGVFNLDSPTDACWDGYVPAVQIRASRR